MAGDKRTFGDMNLSTQYFMDSDFNATSPWNNHADDMGFSQPQLQQMTAAQFLNLQASQRRNHAMANPSFSNQYPNKRQNLQTLPHIYATNSYNPQFQPSLPYPQNTQSMMRQPDMSTVSTIHAYNDPVQNISTDWDKFVPDHVSQQGAMFDSQGVPFQTQQPGQIRSQPADRANLRVGNTPLLYSAMSTPPMPHSRPASYAQSHTPTRRGAGKVSHMDNRNQYNMNQQEQVRQIHHSRMNHGFTQRSTPYQYPMGTPGSSNQPSNGATTRSGMDVNYQLPIPQTMQNNSHSNSATTMQGRASNQAYNQSMRQSAASSQQTFNSPVAALYHHNLGTFPPTPATMNRKAQMLNYHPIQLDPHLCKTPTTQITGLQDSNNDYVSQQLAFGDMGDVFTGMNEQLWTDKPDTVFNAKLKQTQPQTNVSINGPGINNWDTDGSNRYGTQPQNSFWLGRQMQQPPKGSVTTHSKLQNLPQIQQTIGGMGSGIGMNVTTSVTTQQPVKETQASRYCPREKSDVRVNMSVDNPQPLAHSTPRLDSISQRGNKRKFGEVAAASDAEVQQNKKLKEVPSLVDVNWLKALQLPEERADEEQQKDAEGHVTPDIDWSTFLSTPEDELDATIQSEQNDIDGSIQQFSFQVGPYDNNETDLSLVQAPQTEVDHSRQNIPDPSPQYIGHKSLLPNPEVASPTPKSSKARRNTVVKEAITKQPETKGKKRKRTAFNTSKSRDAVDHVSPVLRPQGYYNNTVANKVLAELYSGNTATYTDHVPNVAESCAMVAKSDKATKSAREASINTNAVPLATANLAKDTDISGSSKYDDLPGMNPTRPDFNPYLVHVSELESPEGRRAALHRSVAAALADNPTCAPSPGYKASRLNTLADLPAHGERQPVSGPLLLSHSPTTTTLRLPSHKVACSETAGTKGTKDAANLNSSNQTAKTSTENHKAHQDVIGAEPHVTAGKPEEYRREAAQERVEFPKSKEIQPSVKDASIPGSSTISTVIPSPRERLEAREVMDGYKKDQVPTVERGLPDHESVVQPDNLSMGESNVMDMNFIDHLFSDSPVDDAQKFEQHNKESTGSQQDDLFGEIGDWPHVSDEANDAEKEALERLLTLNGTQRFPSYHPSVYYSDEYYEAFEKQETRQNAHAESNIRT